MTLDAFRFLTLGLALVFSSMQLDSFHKFNWKKATLTCTVMALPHALEWEDAVMAADRIVLLQNGDTRMPRRRL
jgi:hypothetical protein